MAPGGSAMEGNSKLRHTACKYWSFTGFYDGSIGSINSFKTQLGNVGYYHFGEEVCPTTGKKHLQGFVQLRKKGRPMEAFKEWQWRWFACKGSEKQNMKYTGKDGKVHTNMDIIIDELDGVELYDWQKEIVEIINGPVDTRKIHWYWEPNGGVGKSTFFRHLCIQDSGVYVLGGSAKDAKNALASMKKKPHTVIFNNTKSQEEPLTYSGIEDIKDACFFSAKYESGMVLMNKPHIIVFSNEPPNESKMTKNRFIIRRIGEDG